MARQGIRDWDRIKLLISELSSDNDTASILGYKGMRAYYVMLRGLNDNNYVIYRLVNSIVFKIQC